MFQNEMLPTPGMFCLPLYLYLVVLINIYWSLLSTCRKSLQPNILDVSNATTCLKLTKDDVKLRYPQDAHAHFMDIHSDELDLASLEDAFHVWRNALKDMILTR